VLKSAKLFSKRDLNKRTKIIAIFVFNSQLLEFKILYLKIKMPIFFMINPYIVNRQSIPKKPPQSKL